MPKAHLAHASVMSVMLDNGVPARSELVMKNA
jgi:hypothetical protein